MEVIEDLFGVKAHSSYVGATIPIPALATKVKAAGITDAMLKGIHCYNSFDNLPEGSTVLLKCGSHDAAVVVPIGKGRLILLGLGTEHPSDTLEETIFDFIYSYKLLKPAEQSATGGILLFQTSPDEKRVLGHLLPHRITVVRYEDAVETLAHGGAFGDYRILVMGNGRFRNIPPTDVTADVKKGLADFVRNGGDLIFFPEMEDNGHFLQEAFDVKLTRGVYKGVILTDSDVAARAEKAGFTNEMLGQIRLYAGCESLPKNAVVLAKANGFPVAAVVPSGKGRFIFLGAAVEPATEHLDEAILSSLYKVDWPKR
jgi:hypothetical protein